MPLARLPSVELVPPRPAWLTAGMVRLAGLGLFVIAVGMIRSRLTPTSAWVVVGVGAGLVVIGGLGFLAATRRLVRRGPFEYATSAVLHLIRRTGLPLLGLAFFVAWTLVYVAMWAFHPEEAFRGLAGRPRFADFFYYAVSTGFISPPNDVVAHSRGVRSATMIEMLTAFALLTTYLSSFVDWQRREAPPEPEPPSAPR